MMGRASSVRPPNISDWNCLSDVGFTAHTLSLVDGTRNMFHAILQWKKRTNVSGIPYDLEEELIIGKIVQFLEKCSTNFFILWAKRDLNVKI